MLTHLFVLLVCTTLQAAAGPFRPQAPFKIKTDEDDGCPTGVHVVGVRGTLEEPGFGAMSTLVEQILKDIPGSDSFAIDYPAGGITIDKNGKPVYDPLRYILSVQEGRSKLNSELIDFNIFCPNSSIVVMAYSQVSLAQGMDGSVANGSFQGSPCRRRCVVWFYLSIFPTVGST